MHTLCPSVVLSLVAVVVVCTCVYTAGISPASFSAHHTAIHDALKGRLSAMTGTLCHALSAEFNSSLGCHGDAGEMELMDFVRDAMFESVVRQLFGRENVPTGKVSLQRPAVSEDHLCLNVRRFEKHHK